MAFSVMYLYESQIKKSIAKFLYSYKIHLALSAAPS